jgi:hypothetical protein
MKQNRLESPPAATDIRTMHDVESVIEGHKRMFATHAFLRALEGHATMEHFKRFVPRVAFFVMCFQDVLRLVHSLSSDPAIKAIAGVHAAEDHGHDLWYLNDVRRLGVPLGVHTLFSDAQRVARDTAYGQIASVLSAHHDQTRLAVALSLEAIGSECFGRAIALLERLESAEGLEYFARKHQAIEQGHQVFESEAQTQLDRILVSQEALPEVLKAIEKTFNGMKALMTDLETAFHASNPARG